MTTTQILENARSAKAQAMLLDTEQKNTVLLKMADALEEDCDFILSENLAIINPPVPEKIKRKILAKLESIHNAEISKKDVTEENIENAKRSLC